MKNIEKNYLRLFEIGWSLSERSLSENRKLNKVEYVSEYEYYNICIEKGNPTMKVKALKKIIEIIKTKIILDHCK